MLPLFTSVVTIFLVSTTGIYSCSSGFSSAAKTKTKEPEIIDPARKIADKNLDKNKLEILIDKSDYALWLLIGKDSIKKYPVVFGGNPFDAKLRQGDRCTPEGSFKIRDLYPHKSWSKFIWIDYPNETSRKNHEAAKKEGKIPANAKIGGDVGIHGVPEGMDHMIDQRTNWTLGCISLKNKDVNEIYALVKKGTKITIRK